jgi:Tfp pilus assembly protein PilW
VIRRLSPKNSPSLHTDVKKLGGVVAVLVLASALFLYLGGPYSEVPPDDSLTRRSASAVISSAVEGKPVILPPAARRTASTWVETYATRTGHKRWESVLHELRPYSTVELLNSMALNSGAPSFTKEDRKRAQDKEATVEAVHVDDVAGQEMVVVVIYEYLRETREGDSSEIRTITLSLVESQRGWRVDEVLVP